MVPSTTPHVPCAIDRPMNSHGGLTLTEVTGNRTYQVVEYATPAVKKALANVDGGSTVRVWLEPLTSRGDAWEAVDVRGRVRTTRRSMSAITQLAVF